MEENSRDNESLYAQVQQLEKERDELHKDIEQLCMQKAGPSYISLATQTYFRRTAGLEQEVENLKKKLADCVKEKSDISDELSEAKRIKTHLDQLLKLEVMKNAEIGKQLEYLRGSIAKAFSDRDHSLMEAEKAKESEEIMSQKLNDAEMRLQELSVDSTEKQEQVINLQMKLEKQDQEIELFRKVVDKFYKIRQQACGGSEDEESNPGDPLENFSWDDKCACLSYDPIESWSYNVRQESSSASYEPEKLRRQLKSFCLKFISDLDFLKMAALVEEIETLRGSVGDLQNRLQMGLEIEKHLKNRISSMEQKKILSDRHIADEISSLREYHKEQRLHIMELLDDEKSYMKSVINNIVQKIGKLHRDIQAAEVTNSDMPAQVADSSETLTRALQEKVSALVLLSQQEERHIWEKNVHDAVQETVDELQRNLKLASEQKVKALLELAEVKQQYQLLLEKTVHDGPQGNLQADPSDRRIVALGQQGTLKSLLKKTSLRRWLSTVDNIPAVAYPNLQPEGFSNNQRSNHSVDNARLRIEYATLKDSISSLERLTSDIRKLRLSLIQAKMTRSSKGLSTSTPRQMDETLREAELLKTALSSALPLSWSGEGETSTTSDEIVGENPNHEGSDTQKIDPVSAAGLEMVELIILAAQIMKEKKSKREHKIK